MRLFRFGDGVSTPAHVFILESSEVRTVHPDRVGGNDESVTGFLLYLAKRTQSVQNDMRRRAQHDS
ncbi:hypothetical protein GCM10009085_45890 [Pseudomonas avellanae]|nr:hypothetical protein GCM10009085_45890 [Pseudomonas avellanae]